MDEQTNLIPEWMEGKKINGTWLTQTGEHFDAIGMMLIDGQTGEISTEISHARDLHVE